jgi:hypothetical protein
MSVANPSLQFRSNDVYGYISGGGTHGVHLVPERAGQPASRRMCMNLEHYYCADGKDGFFVPRLKAETRTELGENTVTVHISPYGDWQVAATVAFQLDLARGGVSVTYTFEFAAAYRCFCFLISNYFLDPTEPHLRLGGDWVQPQLTDAEHRTWPRTPEDAADYAAILDQLERPAKQVAVPIDDCCYSEPILVTPIRDSSLSVINIFERRTCASVSANRCWSAHDATLTLGDVAAGERRTAHGWLFWRELANLDGALQIANELGAT